MLGVEHSVLNGGKTLMSWQAVSLFRAEVCERGSLDVGENGILEEAGSLGFILTNALNLSFSNTQALKQRGDLTFFVQKGLSVGGAEN